MGSSPFLLGASAKKPYAMDFFLNVLLFVPFGFGLSARVSKKNGGRWASLLVALAMGVAVSYTVEFLQLYIPERDSGWSDVISNTAGSVAGFFLFALCGDTVLAELSRWEDSVERWLSPLRGAVLLAAYFAACCGISFFLQSKTRLSNWDPRCTLFVGNEASGRNPWKGQILRLQIWNRAFPELTIRRMAARESLEDSTPDLLGSYDFSISSPYRDQSNFLPELSWTPRKPQPAIAPTAKFEGSSWLRSTVPVEKLTREIKKSNQFTVHIVCAPSITDNASGYIVSLSQSTANVNFHLRQDEEDLVFWFRNPLSETRAILAWDAPAVFEAGKMRDIVASYDGSDAFLYLDGDPVPQTYRLSPGATLMHSFSFIRTADLRAYVIVYETLVFLPAGLLIGVGARNWTRQESAGRWMLALGCLLPAVLLEYFLSGVSGRRIWAGNIAFALIFELVGVLLINADRADRRLKTFARSS